ncbi:hypothetical protein [Gemmatirosa kalamazoonensis]|uniref:hypothetical protein n=1 Tax=Gemmatirosa kalamazoonensis TaxID=861299 RepID=UPI000CE2DA98|nr:hypothetical protein [Gemmatirosa kalamazoonensis]
MRVDESGREQPAAAVDDVGVGMQATQLAVGRDRGDALSDDGDADALPDAGVGQLNAAAGARGARAGRELSDVQEQRLTRRRGDRGELPIALGLLRVLRVSA